MAMCSQAVGHALRKSAGYLLLGGVVLWQVALHAGPTKGQVIVHVANLAGGRDSPVDVKVDDALYRVDGLERSPIVCQVRPGCHVARLILGGRVLYEEEFLIAAGEEIILVASDQYVDGRSPGRRPIEQLGKEASGRARRD